MKKAFLILLPFVMLVACESKGPDSNSQNQESALSKVLRGQSPYIDWYLNGKESFISYSYKNYPQNIKDEQQYTNVRGTEDNTITLKNDMKIRLHDEYKINNEREKTTLELTRTGTILQRASNTSTGAQKAKANNQDIGPFRYYYSINTVYPITITSPTVDIYNPIPMCYYDNFKLNWNYDPTNENGVVVITEWNGCTIYDAPQEMSVVHADIVPDTGHAILSTSLFEDMPDEALVNLWIIRGNVLTLGEEGEGEITLTEALQEPPEFFEELLSSNPNMLLQLQPFMFSSGAVAGFSFFLIRNLHAQGQD